MKLYKHLIKKRDCLDQCARNREACVTVLKTKRSCADRFEACTTKCEHDYTR
jgi:hypothetical protein